MQISQGWPGLFPCGITSAFVYPNGKAYFFSGSQYIRWDVENDRVDQAARDIAAPGAWPGIPGGARAAFVWNNAVYFFHGSQYYRFSIKNNTVDAGYPLPINRADTWPGVWQDGVDAAYFEQSSNSFYFFQRISV